MPIKIRRNFTPQKQQIIPPPQKFYQQLPTKSSPMKKICQEGYDHQEENRILKNYISQMEKTIQDLEIKKKMNKIQVPHSYSYKKLLEDQLEENIEIRQKIEELINEIQRLKEENQYLMKIHQKQ